MDNLFYVLTGRQVGLHNKVEVISNNTANAKTPGFKTENVIFKDHIHRNLNNTELHFNVDYSSYRELKEGQMVATGNPLDLALSGKVYFKVGTSSGTKYTRAGDFHMDANGRVVTAQGYPVLSADDQPIVLPQDSDDLIVRKDGAMTIGQEQVGQLGLAFFDNDLSLKHIGNNLMESVDIPKATGDFILFQGMLELSNTEIVREITRLKDAERDLRYNNTLLKNIDEIVRSSVKTFTEQQS